MVLVVDGFTREVPAWCYDYKSRLQYFHQAQIMLSDKMRRFPQLT